jgi:hypothetical protein
MQTQQNIVLMGIIISVLMAIYPPWVYVDDNKVAHPMGYALLWKPPVERHQDSAELFGIKVALSVQTKTANTIDLFRLLMQIAAVCVITGGAAVVLKRTTA